MAVRSRGIGEQAAQQRDGVAQGLTRISRLAVGPQQSSELAAGMHAPFDRQVEQQSLRLAQGKGEAAQGYSKVSGPSNRARASLGKAAKMRICSGTLRTP